jgi:hypothetical protein
MIRVFNEPPETKMFLKLVQQDEFHAALILVDEDGEKVEAGNVLTISKHGVSYHSAINRDAPFKLTADREIYKCD